MQLTEQLVAKILADTHDKSRFYFDDDPKGFGLRMQVDAKGHVSPSWVVRYRVRGAKVTRQVSLGHPERVKLRAARKAAKTWIAEGEKGIDRLGENRAKAAARQEHKEAETFEAAVEDYIKREQIGRKQNATAGEVKRVLLREFSDWTSKPLDEIEGRGIYRRLEAIRDGDKERDEAGRPYLANRAFAYLKAFLSWCTEPNIRKLAASPMAGMKRPWEGEEERDRVFSDAELKALWSAAETLDEIPGAFLKTLMLLGKRKSALAAMRKQDVDSSGLWTPPADNRRRKGNKRLHAVPLPPLALQVLRPLLRAGDCGDYVFRGRRVGTHLDPGTSLQNEIKEKSGVSDFYYHALRHTAETRMAELGVQPHIRDILLDHSSGRGAGAGYDHHHYRPEMLAALTTWAEHIAKVADVPEAECNVVELVR